jgi:hypothetical protein
MLIVVAPIKSTTGYPPGTHIWIGGNDLALPGSYLLNLFLLLMLLQNKL